MKKITTLVLLTMFGFVGVAEARPKTDVRFYEIPGTDDATRFDWIADNTTCYQIDQEYRANSSQSWRIAVPNLINLQNKAVECRINNLKPAELPYTPTPIKRLQSTVKTETVKAPAVNTDVKVKTDSERKTILIAEILKLKASGKPLTLENLLPIIMMMRN